MKVHLTPAEASAIGWITAWLIDLPEHRTDDPRHPINVLAAKHERTALHEAAVALEANFRGPGFCWIEGPVDLVTADILKASVENNDQAHHSMDMGLEVLAEDTEIAFRSLAYKLEELGIEVDRITSLSDPDARWYVP